MYPYVLQISGQTQGHQFFATKAAAMRAFARAFTFNGTVTLYQGAFQATPYGYVRQFGRAFTLASDQFDDEGQVYPYQTSVRETGC